MAEWAGEQIEFLAQEPGVPLRQLAQGIIDYLMNDNARNHQALKKAAQEAVGEFRKNPARFLGKNLPNLLPSPQEAVNGAKALRAISQVENAAGKLKGVVQAEKAFGNAYNGIVEDGRKFGGAAAGGAPKACFAANACFPTALAEADLFKTGGPFGDGTRVPVRGVRSPSGIAGEDLAHTSQQIEARLQPYGENYQPRHPNSFTPDELKGIQKGVPVKVSGPDQITKILEQEGEGSQGLVFVRYRPMGGNQGPQGHVFNAQNDRRQVVFVDHTVSGDPLFTAALVRDWFFFPIQ